MHECARYSNLGKFKVSSEHEQNIWSECTRLLALSIIYYNSFILSQLAYRQSNLNFIKDISPIQWKHIDMYGHFYFGDYPNEIEINNIMDAIKWLKKSNQLHKNLFEVNYHPAIKAIKNLEEESKILKKYTNNKTKEKINKKHLKDS